MEPIRNPRATPGRHLRLAIAVVVLVVASGIGVAAAAPRVQVSRGAVAVPAGSTDDVGTIPIMMQHPVTYTITNAGDAALSIIDVGLLAPLNGGCSVTDSPAGATVGVGGTATMTIGVRADAAGPAGCTVRIVSNEPQQLYSFVLRGTAAASGSPELEVTRGAETLVDGDVVGAIAAPVGVAAIETLTLANAGTAPLVVSNVEIIDQVGATCVLESAAAHVLAPGEDASARVSITRAGTADFECTLAIQSDDADEDLTVIVFTSRMRGTHYRVLVNDVPVQSVAPADLDDPTKAIEPGLQTSHVVRIENTGTDDMFELFVDVSGACEPSATEPFSSTPVFRSGASEEGVVNLFPEPRGPLEGDICVIDIVHSEAERLHFYVTIKRHRRAPDRGCSAGGGAGWATVGLLALAWCARPRRRRA